MQPTKPTLPSFVGFVGLQISALFIQATIK